MFSTKEYVNSALAELGFREFTEVQAAVIPEALAGKDLMVTSETGSGKTHAFLIPLFEKLEEKVASTQYLISSPTRELAQQTFDFIRQIAAKSPDPLDVRLYTGGTNRLEEIARLKKSQPQIVVGTPGKLKDLVLKENLLDIHQVKTFIVDEADMTLDEGFLPDVDAVAGRMGNSLQMMVFSATLPEKIQPFLRKYLRNPKFIDIAQKNRTSQNISHWFVKTRNRPREEVLHELLGTLRPYFAIVFCNTQESADQVYRLMTEWKENVALLHGGLEARKRRQVLTAVRDLKCQYLVATDLLSRGIDIPDISHIINYELPSDWEFYVHRTGRTGRMAKDGIAVSLYDRDNDEYLDALEARGLKTAYKEIANGALVNGKVRAERQKRIAVVPQSAQKAMSILPKPGKSEVKPGYKKKYREKVESVAKRLAKKRGK